MNSSYQGVARTIRPQITAHQFNFASRPFAKEPVNHIREEVRKYLRITSIDTLGAGQRDMSGKFLLWLQGSKILAGGFDRRLHFRQLSFSVGQSSPDHTRKARVGESADAFSAESQRSKSLANRAKLFVQSIHALRVNISKELQRKMKLLSFCPGHPPLGQCLAQFRLGRCHGVFDLLRDANRDEKPVVLWRTHLRISGKCRARSQDRVLPKGGGLFRSFFGSGNGANRDWLVWVIGWPAYRAVRKWAAGWALNPLWASISPQHPARLARSKWLVQCHS